MNERAKPDRPQPVRCKSGYTYAQRPVSFTYENQEYEVKQIIAEWHEPGKKKFIILSKHSLKFELSFKLEEQLWHIRPVGD